MPANSLALIRSVLGGKKTKRFWFSERKKEGGGVVFRGIINGLWVLILRSESPLTKNTVYGNVRHFFFFCFNFHPCVILLESCSGSGERTPTFPTHGSHVSESVCGESRRAGFSSTDHLCFTEASVLLTSQSAASHDSTDLTFFLLLLYIIFQNVRNTFFLWCTETLLAFYILLLFVTLKQKGEKHVFVFRVASPVAPMSKILLLFSPITDKKSQVSQCQHCLNNHWL